jgi:S-DNA-T family DNA segregation ATPase FtsK/SpoIIIE
MLIGLLCIAGLLSLPQWAIYQDLPAGGIVGYLVATAGSFAFSSFGSALFFVGGLWLSAVLISDRFAILPQPQFVRGLFDRLKLFSFPKLALPAWTLAWKGRLRKEKSPPELGQKLDALFKSRGPKREPIPETPTAPMTPVKSFSLPLFSSERKDDHGAGRELLMKEAPKRKKKSKIQADFESPSLALLEDGPPQNLDISREELIENSKALEQKLADFGIEGQVIDIRPGPIITLYEFEPAAGVKVKNILNLTDDLKMAMKALSIRILAPIPGKAAVGIEIPNARRQTVSLKDILRSQLFEHSASPLTMALGKNTAGEAYIADLSKMPHLLIAGATGSGKSVGLNSIIVSMLYKASPDELKFIMIDPKMLELSLYEGIPHLLLPVVTDPKRASRALQWAVREMERRYKLISSLGARNLKSYNEKVEKLSQEELEREIEEAAKAEASASALMEDEESTEPKESKPQESHEYVKLPFICIVIDELADLIMVSSREVEESIARLAQMARAAGIHLIIATQRPSVDVLTGVIKANFPTRIAYQVASKVDSRTIIDGMGAENLIGDGDMLFLPPGTSRLERLHGPFISDDEIARIVTHLKSQGEADYSTSINLDEQEESEGGPSVYEELDDELYDSALQVVFETQSPSASMLQRRLRIGYNRAARLIERMEAEGIVSCPQGGGKGREILIESSVDYTS